MHWLNGLLPHYLLASHIKPWPLLISHLFFCSISSSTGIFFVRVGGDPCPKLFLATSPVGFEGTENIRAHSRLVICRLHTTHGFPCYFRKCRRVVLPTWKLVNTLIVIRDRVHRHSTSSFKNGMYGRRMYGRRFGYKLILVTQ